MSRLSFIALLAILSIVEPAWAADTRTTSDTDPMSTSDTTPNNAPTAYDTSSNAPFPSVTPPESEAVKPYQMPPHPLLQGSIHHPNPPTTDQSFVVDEKNKVVKMSGGHQLNAFRDWVQERYFDAKFETLNKRFAAIEAKLTELNRRLRLLESKTK